jgi:hypothetical protein
MTTLVTLAVVFFVIGYIAQRGFGKNATL